MSHPCVLITVLAKLAAGENSITMESFVYFSMRVFHMFDAIPLIILCDVQDFAFPWSAEILWLVFLWLAVNMCVCACVQFTIISLYYIWLNFFPSPICDFHSHHSSNILFWKFNYWFPFYLKLAFDSYKDTNTNPLISITSPGGNDESNWLLRTPGCKGKE